MLNRTAHRRHTTPGRRCRSSGVAMISAAALGLYGCNGDDPAPAAEDPEPPSEQTTADELEADPEEERAEDETEATDTDPPGDQPEAGGSGFVMGGLVDSFPASVPLPPDAQLVSSYDPSWEDTRQWGVATISGLDRDAVRDFYTAAFASDGWQLDDSQDTEFFLTMEASGPEYTVNLISSEEDGMTRVDLIVRHAD